MFVVFEMKTTLGKRNFTIVGLNMRAIHKPGYISYPIVWENKQPTVTMMGGKKIVVDLGKLEVLRW